jgi:hypothetical protein
MGVAVLPRRPQPTPRPRSQEVRNRPARLLANYCPVPQAMGCYFILQRQIPFRNRIPARSTSANRVVSQRQRYSKSAGPPCPGRFIHAETSPPGDRKAHLQESTRDSTFPKSPLSTPYSERYGSEKVRSKSCPGTSTFTPLTTPRPRSGKYGNSWLCPETKYAGRYLWNGCVATHPPPHRLQAFSLARLCLSLFVGAASPQLRHRSVASSFIVPPRQLARADHSRAFHAFFDLNAHVIDPLRLVSLG